MKYIAKRPVKVGDVLVGKQVSEIETNVWPIGAHPQAYVSSIPIGVAANDAQRNELVELVRRATIGFGGVL